MTTRHLADITREELQLLGAAASSIDVDEVEGEALYLRLLADGRQWIVEAATGQLVIDVIDESCSGEEEDVFPLSERVRRFADCFTDDTLALSIADDKTIVASAGSATAAIDLIAQKRPTPTSWMMVPSATVAVSMSRFQMLLWSARCLPSGIGEMRYPTPPMWLQFGDGWLGLHVDWSDFLSSRATYRLPTMMQQGHTTTAIPHVLMESFLRHVPTTNDDEEDLELSITVGTVRHEGVPRDAIMFEADAWRLVLWLAHPLATRWAARVNEELTTAGIEVLETDDIESIVKSNGVEVRIKLHHGHPDVARVSALLVLSAEESIELLRELGQLNASSSGVRYWLEDGAVRAAADVPCTALATLPCVIRQVAVARATYAPLIAALGAVTS